MKVLFSSIFSAISEPFETMFFKESAEIAYRCLERDVLIGISGITRCPTIFPSSFTGKLIHFFTGHLRYFTESSPNFYLVLLPDLDDELFTVVADQLIVFTDNGDGGGGGSCRHRTTGYPLFYDYDKFTR